MYNNCTINSDGAKARQPSGLLFTPHQGSKPTASPTLGKALVSPQLRAGVQGNRVVPAEGLRPAAAVLAQLRSCYRIVFHQGQGTRDEGPQKTHTDKQLFWQHRECSKSRVHSMGVLARHCFYAPGFSHHTCMPKMENTDGPRSLHPATLPCSAGHFNMCLTLSLYLNSTDYLNRT